MAVKIPPTPFEKELQGMIVWAKEQEHRLISELKDIKYDLIRAKAKTNALRITFQHHQEEHLTE